MQFILHSCIIILLYRVLLTVSWLWRPRQTLGHSSRKPNPASWLQHELCSRERGTEKKKKPADIIPATSITITLLTNWKPQPTHPALTHWTLPSPNPPLHLTDTMKNSSISLCLNQGRISNRECCTFCGRRASQYPLYGIFMTLCTDCIRSFLRASCAYTK